MPKIRIDEYDNTGTIQLLSGSNTVYIPVASNMETLPDSPIFIDSEKKLEDKAENKNSETETSGFYTTSKSYKICKHLLKLGFSVVIEKVNATTSSTGQSYITIAKELLKDKGLYDIKFLTAGDLTAIIDKNDLTDIAKSRGDCLALLDADSTKQFKKTINYTAPPSGEDPLDPEDPGTSATLTVEALASWKPHNYTEQTYTAWVVDEEQSSPTKTKYKKEEMTVVLDSGIREQFNVNDGKYAAAFAPAWQTTNSDLFTESDAEGAPKYEVIPASFGYLFAYANMCKNNPNWYAAAGAERGFIPELSDVEYHYNSAEIEILQGRAADGAVELGDKDGQGNVKANYMGNDNIGFAINPIANIRPLGTIIYGNRTLNINTLPKRTVATSFLNVRNMISDVKKELYNAAKLFTFEQNSDTLWFNFQSYVKPLLERMKYGNGLAGYKFTRVATTAKARLKAKLTIIPIEAVEDFDLDIYLTDALNVEE